MHSRIAGKDATEDYEEIGHSSTATEMLGKYLIGNFAVRNQYYEYLHESIHRVAAKIATKRYTVPFSGNFLILSHFYFYLQGGAAVTKQKRTLASSSQSDSSAGAALFKALLPILFVIMGVALYLQQAKA